MGEKFLEMPRPPVARQEKDWYNKPKGRISHGLPLIRGKNERNNRASGPVRTRRAPTAGRKVRQNSRKFRRQSQWKRSKSPVQPRADMHRG